MAFLVDKKNYKKIIKYIIIIIIIKFCDCSSYTIIG